MSTITINEVKQAGDVFLLFFNCIHCEYKNIGSYPLNFCDNCKENFSESEIILPRRKQDMILLCGTKRKNHFGKRTIQKLFALSGGACAYCLQSFNRTAYEVEHIKPLAVGGGNEISNLVLSCRQCNAIAGSKCFNGFDQKRKYILNARKIVNIYYQNIDGYRSECHSFERKHTKV